MSLDPLLQANRILTEAISNYLQSSNELAAAAERATAASAGRDATTRRLAFQELSERGNQARFAKKHLTDTVRRLRATLPPAQIEAVAAKLDGRESAESALTLVRTILTERAWSAA
ncbi:hypothetical protein FBZ82_102133 [Azospirillum brasilense]|uniref:Uncharacterized protein n=1 Tax=Azospirillum brasilense TaxID=192 RepID=A0A560C3R0_AZOBR|nr:hypothetical protein [Azospirillum brasilense]MBK3733985.1 hypothetical protein [Azospirillum brasilense]TWA72533.1 hypothetical protein FBZ82_102133 [Azospirillum brasilense]TWA79489.1 hypothetical protein FBZ83_11057 [Azospirillum brasilense]